MNLTSVPWWKRLIYSLVSIVLGAGLCGAGIEAQEFMAHSHGRVTAIGLFTAILFFDGWVILLSLPGWFLAIPIVVAVKDIRGWRFWMYLAIGICFGPALILGLAFYSALRAPSFAGSPEISLSPVYVAGAVSGLSTIVYLLLLRTAQARSAIRATTV